MTMETTSPRKWSKFSLLMWKNFLLMWRHKFNTILEIVIPVLITSLLVVIRSLSEPETYEDPLTYQRLPLQYMQSFRPPKIDTDMQELISKFLGPQLKTKILTKYNASNFIDLIDWRIAYSPSPSPLDGLMNVVSEMLNVTINALENSSVLADIMQTSPRPRPFAGIAFDDEYASLGGLPDHMNYAVRFPAELRSRQNEEDILGANWQTGRLFPEFQSIGPRNRNHSDGGIPPGYYREGFAAIQHAVSVTFIEMKKINPETIIPTIFLQRFPYPPFTRDVLLEVITLIIPFMILASFLIPCINNVKYITLEKEKQLKEVMKIMGLPNWLHWTAWFCKIMIFFLISITLITILLKVSWFPDTYIAVFTHTQWTILWFYLFIYSIATTMFCFMMSTFFSKANTAAAVAGLIFFIFYVPYTFTEQNYDQLSLAQKLLVSIFHNTAMSFGFLLTLKHEGNMEGLTWNNLFRPVTIDDDLTVGHTMIMMIITALIYLAIALYVEKVFPGEFGVASKWYFLFTRKFWCGQDDYNGVEDVVTSQNTKFFEPGPARKHAGVQVKGLRKMYSNKKVALQGLTMNMYDDEITVLLGHNGAGKTTTMSMLTGMFPPSSGTALVNGKDIRLDIEGVRNSLGLCPQHNILFDNLTVREHIKFYSRLKGLDNKQVDAEVKKYVGILELENKIDALTKTLSGGMKRKLSVGVALCGGSKVVLCDEPTSGMDPSARRALWDLLQAEKKGRTILLSTHFMDEADILGDRIGILYDGELKCYGSSFFLKKTFGMGYHLICVKGPHCNTYDITNLLDRYVPGIKVENDIGTELSYQLPDSASKMFQPMLKELEEHSTKLGIDSYGISLTTLDEVFMKVGSDYQNGMIHNNNNTTLDTTNGNGNYTSGDSERSLNSTDTIHLLTGSKLTINQWRAMFMKKVFYTIRNWILLFLQNLIPVCFLIMSILIARTFSVNWVLPPKTMSFEPYTNNPVTMVQRNYFVGTDPELAINIFNEYVAMFDNPPTERTLIQTDMDMELKALEEAGRNIVAFNSRYLVGATISGNEITAWFNNQPFHTIPLSLDTVYNAILRATCGQQCGITVTNHPVPFTYESRLIILSVGNNMGFQLAINIAFAMAFVGAFFIMFYIKERMCRAKLLQFVSGVNVFTFWFTALIWDYIVYLVTACLMIATLAAFQEEGWSEGPELGRVMALLAFFGFAMMPIVYLFSLLFEVPSSGFTRMSMIGIFTGVAFFQVVFVLRIPSLELVHIADGLTWAFLIFPFFALSNGLSNINTLNTIIPFCNSVCNWPSEDCCVEDLPDTCCVGGYFDFKAPGIGRDLTYMAVVGLIMLVILLLKETRVLEGVFYRGKNVVDKVTIPETEEEGGLLDDDVRDEKERVREMTLTDIENHNLVLKDMTKYYGKFLAVNQLCVGVESGSCFGLLGVNGAGKTSTFKMLTGDEIISKGEAWVRGISIKTDMKTVHQIIGYCPQFDALLDDLTGRETLYIYCLLRGISTVQMKELSESLAVELNFMQHIDKKVKEYSGGNKRKLSTAVSLIGNPHVVYLDEPTTGMDPGAKRHLWNIVCKKRDSGKSIILTSHSMEECEALCSRLAIMVNGEFKCLGSTQHLKNKFSKGYILVVQLKRDFEDSLSLVEDAAGTSDSGDNPEGEINEAVKRVKDYVLANFTSAILRESYQGRLTFYIPTTNLKWSSMFGLMEQAKETLNIESYSLSQTSLEQVFLSFTKKQRDESEQNQKS
ncbi:phospholipid-transporting ATPase ABCA3 isoform X2 [Phlebotomus argentipes]|uniref:phospholipid-transporting ATPase ABCA3 isoform X2 n=1 Tax=Phlebotomus argentipes TaxID=94469 RepID=UPI002892F512|nr:phospholipid-transporting ATPase ABCA3 isoform X2 [Phlebotomus argentipes]